MATTQKTLTPVPALKERYQTQAVPALQGSFAYKNSMAIPKLVKVVVHVGTGQGIKDAKFLEMAEATLRRITGQNPVKTTAKKSIANFKIREGMVIGLKVTLRGKRMEDFLTKLIHVALPRVRDFRGLSVDIVDRTGSASLGIKEHLVFPEIHSDEVDRLHGLQVIMHTTAKTKAEGILLLKSLGLPFQEQGHE